MLCLGIESSCDDTSLALINDGRLIGQRSSSQTDLHALFGGVVPEMASREHGRYIGPLCDSLLADCHVTASDIDVIAVARGPGLLGSLLVGSAFAKAFALGSGARLLGVNHLHAHLFAVGLEAEPVLPALGLLVSGGHTQLVRMEGPESIVTLGKTLDDAAGEAFDKAGKMLGLPYPAGRLMDELAEQGTADRKLFPRPYCDNVSLDFSFSGLKTAMAMYVNVHVPLKVTWDAASGKTCIPNEQRALLNDICASFRLAVVETLAYKVEKALLHPAMHDVRSVIIAGGVASNSLLRRRMNDIALHHNLAFFAPSPGLCTDNGAMIGYLGWQLARRGCCHDLDLEAIARGGRIPDDMHICTLEN